MKERFWRFLLNLVLICFYTLKKAEYLQFPVYNEFLIKTWKGKIGFLGYKKTVTRSIGEDRAVLQKEAVALMKEGTKVLVRVLSLGNLDQLISEYPELAQDEWIKLHQTAVSSDADRKK